MPLLDLVARGTDGLALGAPAFGRKTGGAVDHKKLVVVGDLELLAPRPVAADVPQGHAVAPLEGTAGLILPLAVAWLVRNGVHVGQDLGRGDVEPGLGGLWL